VSRAKVCLSKPTRSGRYRFVCDVVADLEPMPGGYTATVRGVKVLPLPGWRLVNQGTGYPVLKVEPDGTGGLVLTCRK
jgi:hypothetical protein